MQQIGESGNKGWQKRNPRDERVGDESSRDKTATHKSSGEHNSGGHIPGEKSSRDPTSECFTEQEYGE